MSGLPGGCGGPMVLPDTVHDTSSGKVGGPAYTPLPRAAYMPAVPLVLFTIAQRRSTTPRPTIETAPPPEPSAAELSSIRQSSIRPPVSCRPAPSYAMLLRTTQRRITG